MATDYDGTISPIVTDPEKAYPHDEAVRALRGLAALPSTSAAVISGRALKDLAALSRLPVEVISDQDSSWPDFDLSAHAQAAEAVA